MRLERAEWGTDLPSVETQLETQRHVHSSVEDLGSSVKEARMYEVRRHGLGDTARGTCVGSRGHRDRLLWVKVPGTEVFVKDGASELMLGWCKRLLP